MQTLKIQVTESARKRLLDRLAESDEHNAIRLSTTGYS